jgi:vacuolar-type H+-ATPase subunit C/Vma6
MAILAIYSANFNATTRLTTEIFAFEKVIITVTQNYARTVHLGAKILLSFILHIDALNHLMPVKSR